MLHPKPSVKILKISVKKNYFKIKNSILFILEKIWYFQL
jgi:hypothetical protein